MFIRVRKRIEEEKRGREENLPFLLLHRCSFFVQVWVEEKAKTLKLYLIVEAVVLTSTIRSVIG